MAPNNPSETTPSPDQKTLHVWSKPIEQKDGQSQDGSGTPSPQGRPTLTDAVATIKSEDFVNVASTPCARNGFLTGIASGAGVGGLKFVLQGNAIKAANWAVGIFVLGSTLSYEYCQYQRRVEKIQMKRHIEIVSENRREQARKLAEEKKEKVRIEQDIKAAQRPWYRFW
ncbi:Cox20/FAM36A [Purpureocillium lavendulum]|uniref:Cytochrome c oxidase assembly protein COX20, mitochondrial n=1 Tax=Purpureocillium lavendulum TaxID=1247861 RepID=A0AB34FQA6_9HYPO|nr:Cox20/FAM36A [Purpureocillium lavendulum]